MNFLIAWLILFFVLIPGSEVWTQPKVDIGVSIGPQGMQSFYLSIQQYYGVPEKEIVVIRERRIPDEEIPVVFFIARQARVAPAAIIDLRRGGKSWMEITLRLGLSPEIFYVPVPIVVKGPPYGKAYGYYKGRPKKEWGKIRLVDADIVNLVNLRFISEYHRSSPEEVIRMRSAGKTFVVVHEEIKKGKGKKEVLKEREVRHEREGGRERGRERERVREREGEREIEVEREEEREKGRGKGKGKGREKD